MLSNLYAVAYPDGLFELRWDDPGPSFKAYPIRYSGPAPVELPTGRLTADEWHQWTSELVEQRGYDEQFELRTGNEPPIEDLSQPPAPLRHSVSQRLIPPGAWEIVLRLANQEAKPIAVDPDGVRLVQAVQAPDPDDNPNPAMVAEFIFRPTDADRAAAPIAPGERREYTLSLADTATVQDLIRSWSLDLFWLSLRKDGREFMRAGGWALSPLRLY